MLDEIQKYIADGQEIKQAFVAYITDKSISLEERWAVFGVAPVEFKNQKNHALNFKAELTLPDQEIVWYDDFNIEKYETVVMFNFINLQIEELTSSYRSLHKKNYTLEFFNSMKEEVLEKNMHSFKFDW